MSFQPLNLTVETAEARATEYNNIRIKQNYSRRGHKMKFKKTLNPQIMETSDF